MLIIYYVYQKTTQYLILKRTYRKHQSQLSHPNNIVLITFETTLRIIKSNKMITKASQKKEVKQWCSIFYLKKQENHRKKWKQVLTIQMIEEELSSTSRFNNFKKRRNTISRSLCNKGGSKTLQR